jgi:tetratricopeptide (TPR) repeat protein
MSRTIRLCFHPTSAFRFTDQVKAREAAGSIARYGESLFKQVFEENHNVYARYKAAVQAGLSTVQLEIAGSPLFHTLHWEALKDPELRLPLALQATMVRKNLNPSTIEASVRPSPTINLLIVTARPSGRSDVGYRTISRPLVEALRQANLPVQIDLEDWLLPVVYQNQPVQVQPREFTAEERAAWFERKAEEQRYSPPEPHYGFVGRDLDILEIERRLLLKRNLLLVRGMGGAGKTTLLRHLGAWWHTTGFVERVFYFGYDEQTWTFEQIMLEMAQQLYGPQYYTNFQPLSLAARQAMLAHELRSANHLLILDNLESITGAELAIQHTLPPDEQDRLRSFLADLAKGRTLVLLGSRGGERWLAKGTFEDNIYELPGLDPEAASTLTDRILEQHNATKYREETDFQKLLKLLDGFPLALEVILANLARQAPGEVLAALQAGDVKLDTPSSQEKTKSILRCIDYSHSNLSPDAQQLLLCLAPFTSVIWLDMLDNYTEQLRQQHTLAALPLERWPEVLRLAQHWGLLSPDPAIPGFLRLQPIFPYFLRNRLQEPAQAEVKQAVERAFREHYSEFGGILHDLLQSKDPQKRHKGQVLTQLEYENLLTALKLALSAQTWIIGPYIALEGYLDAIYDSQRGLELGQMMLNHLQDYPAEQRIDFWKFEVSIVIDNMARHKLQLKDYETAEALYHRAHSIYVEEMNADTDEVRKMIADNYHQLGIVAELQRLWTQAKEYYQQALQIKINFHDRYSQATTYYQLGIVAQQQGEWLQAEQYYQQALQIEIEFNDLDAQADTYHQLARLAQEQGHWNQSEQHYLQALHIYVDLKDRYKQAMTYLNLGSLAQKQRQWNRAEGYYLQALPIFTDFNDRYRQADIFSNLGWIAQEQQQWDQARDYFLQALEIFTAYEDAEAARSALFGLALLWQRNDDPDLLSGIASIFEMSLEEMKGLLNFIVKNKSGK